MSLPFEDARSGALPASLEADICIVGAGAAGLSLARRLSGTARQVLLVESGGLDIEGDTQALYFGENLGLPYFDLATCRLRYFGGTTNHWGGYCRANDPVDYEGRSELGLPRWPFGAETLAPHVDAAARALGLDPAQFDPEAAVVARGYDPESLPERRSGALLTKVFQLAPNLRLGLIHRDDLARAKNLRVVTNLNVTGIRLAPGGRRVTHLDAKTLDGHEIRILPRVTVLCCHAIENARLLLASDDVMPGGIGNGSDLVGRNFMDHIHLTASRMIPAPDFPALLDENLARRTGLNANLGFTDDTLRRAGLLQYYCRFRPVYLEKGTDRAFRHVKRDFMKPGDVQFLRDLATVLTDLAPAVRYQLAVRDDRVPQPLYYVLDQRIEQAPNPESRVVLSDRRDALGSRIADLDWRVSETDIDSFTRGQELMARLLAEAGYGRFQLETIDRALVEDRVEGHYHNIGTTRMGEDPATSVVDADGRVHGVDNLYVGGSSVFPTAGYSGPTMMIIALAYRLADHLLERDG